MKMKTWKDILKAEGREVSFSSERILVTRHAGLVDFFESKGIRFERVVFHASPSDVQGKEVWGVLPHSLSCLCSKYIEVALRIPAELRGKELTKEDVEKYMLGIFEYKVKVEEIKI